MKNLQAGSDRERKCMQNFNSFMPFWKSYRTVVIFLSALSFLLAACAPNKAVLQEQANRHRTRSIGYWGLEWQKKPFAERIAMAPADLIEKIAIDNRLYDLEERPTAAETAPEFADALRKIESLLPAKVRTLAGERIIGLFLVRELGGTGYAEAILDEAGKERFAVIVLDREVLLKRTANDWAAWREGSFFRPSPWAKLDLKLRIEEDHYDSVENAIVYILLHEIGHALGMASGVHPSWNGDTVVSDAYPFTQLSWRMKGNTVESLFVGEFAERKDLKAYAFDRATLFTNQMAATYRKLTRTSFPTLYASASLWEDFAESFANYLHVIRGKRPYEIHIAGAGMQEEVFSPCWNENRCAAKRAFLERWMEQPLP
jgi:hypothetical protein